MKITMNQDEISSLLYDHVNAMLNLPLGKTIVIELSSTRGVGITAEVDVVDQTIDMGTGEVKVAEVIQDNIKDTVEAEVKPVRTPLFAGFKA